MYVSGRNTDNIPQIGALMSTGPMPIEFSELSSHNPMLSTGASESFDANGLEAPSVVRYGGELYMFYTAQNSDGDHSVGLARSSHGYQWAKDETNPVFVPSTRGWDNGGVGHVSVVHDGAQFVMLYTGYAGGGKWTSGEIGAATSDDGVTWTRVNDGNPVLRHGSSGWDQYGVLAPRLWYDNGRYYANFAAKEVGGLTSDVGHAWAENLSDWTKSPNNPILVAGDTQYTELEWGTALRVGGTWLMFSPAWDNGGASTLWYGI